MKKKGGKPNLSAFKTTPLKEMNTLLAKQKLHLTIPSKIRTLLIPGRKGRMAKLSNYIPNDKAKSPVRY